MSVFRKPRLDSVQNSAMDYVASRRDARAWPTCRSLSHEAELASFGLFPAACDDSSSPPRYVTLQLVMIL